MWTKPWSMKEGFAIGGGLLAIGLLLQLTLGAIWWYAFAWPVNLIVLTAFLLFIVVATFLRNNNYPFHFLTTHRAAVPALVYAAALTIIMGLTRQSEGGSWFHDMLAFWPFALIYVYIAFLLALISFRRLSHMLRHDKRHHKGTHRNWLRDISFLLNHVGLFLVLVCASLGSPDIQRLRMVATIGQPESRAFNEEQLVKSIPMTIELKRFILETYDDGSPRRFASEIEVLVDKKKRVMATVDVNHPAKIQGWKIYQYGYDTSKGADSQISILELIHDPWLPYVYTGIYMMLAGAILLFLQRSYSSRGLTEEEYRKRLKAKDARKAEKAKKQKEFFSTDKTEHHKHHSHHSGSSEHSGHSGSSDHSGHSGHSDSDDPLPPHFHVEH